MFAFLKNFAALIGVGFCMFLWQNPNQTGAVFEQVSQWRQDLQEWSEAVQQVKEQNQQQI